ncbi:---NA--- : [Gemmataceae bacterium]|nr:---NA--- : [Gemmataceae bacterium]VTU01044.1 ---NA--- : [Gemmataceae bacterium]
MSTPAHVLIDAARHYARRTAGQGVRSVNLQLTDGTKLKIEVPPAPSEDWPPAAGWHARGEHGAYNGTTFKLPGKLAALFRELVEAGDAGLTAADMKVKVWDRHTEDRTVQNAVSRLRAVIREALGLADDTDPVESSEDRYRLVAPDAG